MDSIISNLYSSMQTSQVFTQKLYFLKVPKYLDAKDRARNYIPREMRNDLTQSSIAQSEMP